MAQVRLDGGDVVPGVVGFGHLALSAALFGQFFFLTLFVQDVLGYSPLRAGLAFLPITGAIVVTAQFAARSLPRIGPKRLMTAGALLGTVGLVVVRARTPQVVPVESS